MNKEQRNIHAMYDPNSDHHNNYRLSQQQYVKDKYPGRPSSGSMGVSNLAQGGQHINPYVAQSHKKGPFVGANNSNSAGAGSGPFSYANQYIGNQYVVHPHNSNSEAIPVYEPHPRSSFADEPQAGTSYPVESQPGGPQRGGNGHQTQIGRYSDLTESNEDSSDHHHHHDDSHHYHDDPHFHKYPYFTGNPYYAANPYYIMDPRLLTHAYYAGRYPTRSSGHSNSSRERSKDEASVPVMMKYPVVYSPDKTPYPPHVRRDRIAPEVHGKIVKQSHHDTTQMHGRRYYVPVFPGFAPNNHHGMPEMYTFNKHNETEDIPDSQNPNSQSTTSCPSSSRPGPALAPTTESRDPTNTISQDFTATEPSDVGQGPRFTAAGNVSSNISTAVQTSVPSGVQEKVTKDASSSPRRSSRDTSAKSSSALQSNTDFCRLAKRNASIDIIEKVLSEPHAKKGMRVEDIQRHLIKHHPACRFLGHGTFTSTILRILDTDPRFYAVKQSDTEGKYWGVHRFYNGDKQYSSALPVRSFKYLSSRLEALELSPTRIVEIPEFDHAEEELTAKDLLYGAFLARPHPITLAADEVYELILLLYPNQRYVHIKAKLAWLLKTSSNFSGVLTPQNTMCYILNDDFLKVHGVRKHFLQEYLKERLLKTNYKALYRFTFLFREALNLSTVASAAQVECNQVYVPAVQTTNVDDVALTPTPDAQVGSGISETTGAEPKNKPAGDTSIDEPIQEEPGPSNDQLPREGHLKAKVSDKSNTKKTPFREVSASDQNKGNSDRKENSSKEMYHEEATDRDATSKSCEPKSTQNVAPVIPGPVMPIVDQSSDSDNDNSDSVDFIPEKAPNFRLSGFAMITGLFLALPRGKELTSNQVCEGVAFLYSTRYRPPTIYSILNNNGCFKKWITVQKQTYTLDEAYASKRHVRSKYLKERMVTQLKSKNPNMMSLKGLYETLDEVLGPQFKPRKARETLDCNSITAMSDFVTRMMQASPSGGVTTVEILDKIIKQSPRYRNYAYSTMQTKIHAVLNSDRFVKVPRGPATFWTLKDKSPAEPEQAQPKPRDPKPRDLKQRDLKQRDPKHTDRDQQRIKVSLFVESDEESDQDYDDDEDDD